MIHHHTKENSSYSVSSAKWINKILVQLQDVYGEQARVGLTTEEASNLVELLQYAIDDLKGDSGQND